MKTRKRHVRRHAQKPRRTKKYKGGKNGAYDEYSSQFEIGEEEERRNKIEEERIEKEKEEEKERKRAYDQANETFMNDPESGTSAEKEKFIDIYEKQYTTKKNKTNAKLVRLYSEYEIFKDINNNYDDQIKIIFEKLFPVNKCKSKENLIGHFLKIIDRLKSRKIYKPLNNDVLSSCGNSTCYEMIKKIIMYFNYHQTDNKFKVTPKAKIAILYNFEELNLLSEYPSYLEFNEIQEKAKSILKRLQKDNDIYIDDIIEDIPPNEMNRYFFNSEGFDGIERYVDTTTSEEKFKIGKGIEENKENKSFKIEDKRYSLFLILLQIINILFCNAGRGLKNDKNCIEGNFFGKHGFIGTLEKLLNDEEEPAVVADDNFGYGNEPIYDLATPDDDPPAEGGRKTRRKQKKQRKTKKRKTKKHNKN
jgi:hypothetical protein